LSRSASRAALALCVAGLLAAVHASAQQTDPKADLGLRVSGLVGIGGSPDGSPDDHLDHFSFQLGFAWEADDDLLVGLRYGQLTFDSGGLGARPEPTLDYVTVGGEYLFNEGYYVSGVYLAIGGYRLGDGGSGLGSETALGGAVGLTGDFRITDRVSVLVDLSVHYAELEDVDGLGIGLVGIGYRF